MMKAVQLKTSETKYKSSNVHLTNLYHDNLREGIQLGSGQPIHPSQGTGDGSRIGDQIYVSGFRLRGEAEVAYDRKNTTFKCWLLEYDETTSGSATVYTNLFHNVSGNGLTDSIQSKRYKVIKCWTMRYKGLSTDAHDTPVTGTILFNKWIPLKRNIHYQSDSSTAITKGIKQNLTLVVLPYDTYSTSAVSDIVCTNFTCCATMYYKDP